LNTNDVKHTIQADIIEKEEEQTDRWTVSLHKAPTFENRCTGKGAKGKEKGNALLIASLIFLDLLLLV